MTNATAAEFAQSLTDAVWGELEDELDNVDSFESAGVLTSNDGFVVKMRDGSEFQVTVVRSR